jgi:hypothetical protein
VPSRVYSQLDTDVTPPSPFRAQRLDSYIQAPGTYDDATIELTVDAHGTVEAVKAGRAPRTLAESLLLTTALHAAKSWHFRPAMKDGAPVPYRQLIVFRERTEATRASEASDSEN